MAKKSNKLAAMPSEDEWQTEEDLRILMRAEEIEKNAQRMRKVRALAKRRIGELNKVKGEKD